MAKAKDVAAYILRRQGQMDAMKLQKLVYYSQAWSLVWEGAPLFREKIEAWAYGPVVRSLFNQHRGKFVITRRDITGDARTLSGVQRETIDSVLDAYGEKSGSWLSDLTHREKPWKAARSGLVPGAASNRAITNDSLRNYYGPMTTSNATPVQDLD